MMVVLCVRLQERFVLMAEGRMQIRPFRFSSRESFEKTFSLNCQRQWLLLKQLHHKVFKLAAIQLMKKLLFTLAVAGLITGCSHRYVITLNNHYRITAMSKPRLQDGNYYFKDANGQTNSIPAGRVKEIAPASMVKEEKSPFKPQTR